MEAFGDALGLRDDALETTLETYRDYGNQSSVSVLTALQHTLEQNDEVGLGYMMGLGPGIHMEYGLCKVTPRKENQLRSKCKETTYRERADISSALEVFAI